MYRLNEERILVVDDEESICGLIRKILESHGYTVSTVNSAREAKTLIEKQQFNLILTDLQMPGESGLELAGYLRNSFHHSNHHRRSADGERSPCTRYLWIYCQAGRQKSALDQYRQCIAAKEPGTGSLEMPRKPGEGR